ncbi:hypothetical protein, partial [Ferrimicrobium sp.]|uniref:hypothetical protein n=1 Tax=Ferrimicrobium sp. TaxID=2926050 RepID=UPI00262CBEDB
MKIDAVIDDEIIPVQVVKRGNTVYIRRCAVTMFQPTEKQKEVYPASLLALFAGQARVAASDWQPSPT